MNKKKYEPPRIEALQERLAGKHQIFDMQPSIVFSEHYDIDQLISEYGSPLFVLSEVALRQAFQDFKTLFSASGIETRIAYSYKTNYLPAVCAVIHSEGALAEVVSGMEYDLARSLGVTGDRIIFNGPYKKMHEISRAIKDGALINIDSFDELDRVVECAGKCATSANVGIRVHFHKGSYSWDRFGFDYESGEYRIALERIASATELNFMALHNHSGTFQLDPDVYGKSANVLLDVVRTARELGLRPGIIDLGGGFPSDNILKPDFDLPYGHNDGMKSLSTFADEILSVLSEHLDLFDQRPVLVLEPGRALVDAAMQLITTVVSSKNRSEGRQSLVIDAGVNILPTAYWYDHGVEADIDSSDRYQTELYGPLCMQIDKVRSGASLPALKSGQRLTISNVGAYCITQSMQFIQPRPAVILLGRNGPEVIRRRETWEDIFTLDRIPLDLQTGEEDPRWLNG